MIKNKSAFSIGIFVILIETFFGVPSSWKFALLMLSGLLLVILSIKITLPKKMPRRVSRRKEKVTPVFVENVPMDIAEPQKSEDVKI